MPAVARALVRSMRSMTAFVLAASLLLPMGAAADQREDRIKAALIFKLVKFIDWPSSAWAPGDRLQLCALGMSGVGQALAAADGKPVRDRIAQFRWIETLSAAQVKGCHVLFIPAGAREIGDAPPAALRGRSTLTVSDAPEFARRGGMVGLVRGENKIGFEINLRAARDAGLDPEAPLLELATLVE